MGFPRQEYWSGVPFPLSGDLPDPGIEPKPPVSPALVGRFFTAETPGKSTSDANISDYNGRVGLSSYGFFGHTVFQLPLSALHYSGYLWWALRIFTLLQHSAEFISSNLDHSFLQLDSPAPWRCKKGRYWVRLGSNVCVMIHEPTCSQERRFHLRGGCCCYSAAQECPALCDPMDCSPPGSSVHGILQARVLEWVAMPSSRGSSQPKDGTCVSRIAGGFFTMAALGKLLYRDDSCILASWTQQILLLQRQPWLRLPDLFPRKA